MLSVQKHRWEPGHTRDETDRHGNETPPVPPRDSGTPTSLTTSTLLATFRTLSGLASNAALLRAQMLHPFPRLPRPRPWLDSNSTDKGGGAAPPPRRTAGASRWATLRKPYEIHEVHVFNYSCGIRISGYVVKENDCIDAPSMPSSYSTHARGPPMTPSGADAGGTSGTLTVGPSLVGPSRAVARTAGP